jgi:hypothetical protein
LSFFCSMDRAETVFGIVGIMFCLRVLKLDILHMLFFEWEGLQLPEE